MSRGSKRGQDTRRQELHDLARLSRRAEPSQPDPVSGGQSRAPEAMRAQEHRMVDEQLQACLTRVHAFFALLHRKVDAKYGVQTRFSSSPYQAATSMRSAPLPDLDRPDEIDLHGFTKEDALITVDLYLWNAITTGTFRVRIIHGMGQGALRDAVRALLSSSDLVEKQEPALSNEGGDGATIAYLKRRLPGT